ncbi:MAG: SRPBCC family protein [Chloroflexi bacterium]|nr:SRPBCC family protein [Chloroflexota bacterium]
MASTEIQAKIDIQGAPATVWQAFRDIEAWPRWYPGVLTATWQTGEPWTPQARMQLQVQNSLRRTMTSVATVRSAPAGLLIWENLVPGLRTVCHARVDLIDGGARFTLAKTYSGSAVILLRLLKKRQIQMLHQGLENLRRLVEEGAPP